MFFEKLPPKENSPSEGFYPSDSSFVISFPYFQDTITLIADSLAIVYSSLERTQLPIHDIGTVNGFDYRFVHISGLPYSWYLLHGLGQQNFSRLETDSISRGTLYPIKSNSAGIMKRLSGTWKEQIKTSDEKQASLNHMFNAPSNERSKQLSIMRINQNEIGINQGNDQIEYRFQLDTTGKNMFLYEKHYKQWIFWRILFLSDDILYLERNYLNGSEKDRIFYKRLG